MNRFLVRAQFNSIENKTKAINLIKKNCHNLTEKNFSHTISKDEKITGLELIKNLIYRMTNNKQKQRYVYKVNITTPYENIITIKRKLDNFATKVKIEDLHKNEEIGIRKN